MSRCSGTRPSSIASNTHLHPPQTKFWGGSARVSVAGGQLWWRLSVAICQTSTANRHHRSLTNKSPSSPSTNGVLGRVSPRQRGWGGASAATNVLATLSRHLSPNEVCGGSASQPRIKVEEKSPGSVGRAIYGCYDFSHSQFSLPSTAAERGKVAGGSTNVIWE